ncbi:hypothetical protein MMC25_002439 [Agyrium rufum]|nr:hypothetical protein [Agyrium rufum]
MAESPGRRGSTPSSSIPAKRALGLEDEQHMPAVSSPLNPDAGNARTKRAPAREQRDKKDSLKKRESKGIDGPRGATTEAPTQGRKSKKGAEKVVDNDVVLSPMKYPMLAPPKGTDFDPPAAPTLTPISEKAHRVFHESSEHPHNRKLYRYVQCIADPNFPSSHFFRQTEVEPYEARLNHEDSAAHILFSDDAKSVTTEKGYRTIRANVVAREGRWYWEARVLSGIKKSSQESNSGDAPAPHIRLGWARREASLDSPVGADSYSYGLRDVSGQKIHRSRPTDFMSPGEHIYEGDVVGLEIQLPSIALHRKVVDGSYNKAVDVSDEVEKPTPEGSNFVRDRVPIRFKGHNLYFESYEYHATKEMEDLTNPAPAAPGTSTANSVAPNPNHPITQLRTLPLSLIKIYKNGKLVGTPFENLHAFLPVASKPPAIQSARDGLDDGMLGYYPAISVFRGGAVETNFGPKFWCPPENVIKEEEDVQMTDDGADSYSQRTSLHRLRPMCERYAEQIADDVLWDIVDEVELSTLDGGNNGGDSASKMQAPISRAGVEAAVLNPGDVPSELTAPSGEIKDFVQEEE